MTLKVFRFLWLLIIVLFSSSAGVTQAANPTLSNLAPNTAVSFGIYEPARLAGCIAYAHDITAQSRLNYDSVNHQILMFGGGHAAIPRDDVDVLNLNTLTWQSAYPSTPVSDMSFANMNKDNGSWLTTGHPITRHTYDGLNFIPSTNELVMVNTVGPQPLCQTELANWYLYPGTAWHYNPSTKVWTPGGSLLPWKSEVALATEYDPISGKIFILGRNGLYTYDPISKDSLKVKNFYMPELLYAMSLVYYPPNQKMYYVMQNGSVYELTLDRSNLVNSTVVKMNTTGSAPNYPLPPTTDAGETAFVYDSANQIIGGGIQGGIFYAFDPRSAVWNKSSMVSVSAGESIGDITKSHTIDYDPVNNVYIFISRVIINSVGYYRTWAYKYANGNIPAQGNQGLPLPVFPPATPASDTQVPTVPTGLIASPVSHNQINLSWSVSTDNVGVSGYKLYRNGSLVISQPGTSYSDSGLTASTTYTYTVSSFDSAGNESSKSLGVNVTTKSLAQVVVVPTPAVGPPPTQSFEPGQPTIPETALHVYDSTVTGTTWLQLGYTFIDAVWTHPGGDYVDLEGNIQGVKPFASAVLTANNTEQALQFNVTELIKRHLSNETNRIPNRGWIVKFDSGKTLGSFYSRESEVISKRPKLRVVTTTGTYDLDVNSDSGMTSTSVTALGNSLTTMSVSSNARIALWFDLSKISGTITSATLTLTSTATQYSGGTSTLGLYPVDVREMFNPIPVTRGIASRYTNDVNIEKDPDVLFADRFPDNQMQNRGWHWDGNNKIIQNNRAFIDDVDPNDPNYKPLAPGVRAYKMTIPVGEHGGSYGDWFFWSNLGYEPEEIYMRAYARFGSNSETGYGKFPFGIDATYNPVNALGFPGNTYIPLNPATGRKWKRDNMPAHAGNGGSTSNGMNGWSARGYYINEDCAGGFCSSVANTSPVTAAGYRGLGYYIYSKDQGGAYGDILTWRKGLLGLVPKNQWVEIEEYVKLNTVNPDGTGNKDGIIRAWVNGRLAFEKKDLRVRDWPGNYAGAMNIKMDGLWLDFYNGGAQVAATPLSVYLSNIVIAKSYIGPASFNASVPVTVQQAYVPKQVIQSPTSPIVPTTPVQTIPVNTTLPNVVNTLVNTNPTGLNNQNQTQSTIYGSNVQSSEIKAVNSARVGVSAKVISPDRLELSWRPIVDSVYPTIAYKILRDGVPIASVYGTDFSDRTAVIGKEHKYEIMPINQNSEKVGNISMLKVPASRKYGLVFEAEANGTPIINTTNINSVSTQVTVALSKNSTANNISAVCSELSMRKLSKGLSLGARNESVLVLQCGLIRLGYLGQEYTTGYFGNITLSAVRRMQCDKLNVCSGSINSTGFGFVGNRTRTILNQN